MIWLSCCKYLKIMTITPYNLMAFEKISHNWHGLHLYSTACGLCVHHCMWFKTYITILPGSWGLAICVSWWPGLIYAAGIISPFTESAQYINMNIYFQKRRWGKESDSAQYLADGLTSANWCQICLTLYIYNICIYICVWIDHTRWIMRLLLIEVGKCIHLYIYILFSFMSNMVAVPNRVLLISALCLFCDSFPVTSHFL